MYISDEVDELLDVNHLKTYYIVSTFQDRLKLVETAENYGITIDGVIVYEYDNTKLYDAAKLMGFEDIMPPC